MASVSGFYEVKTNFGRNKYQEITLFCQISSITIIALSWILESVLGPIEAIFGFENF